MAKDFNFDEETAEELRHWRNKQLERLGFYSKEEEGEESRPRGPFGLLSLVKLCLAVGLREGEKVEDPSKGDQKYRGTDVDPEGQLLELAGEEYFEYAVGGWRLVKKDFEDGMTPAEVWEKYSGGGE